MLPSFLGWMGLTLNVGPRWEGSLAPGSLLPQLLIKSWCWFLVWPLTVQHELQLPSECGLGVLYQLLFLNRECSWAKQNHPARSDANWPNGHWKKGEIKNFSFPQQPTLPLVFWCMHFVSSHSSVSQSTQFNFMFWRKQRRSVFLAWWKGKTGSHLAGAS